MLLVRGQSRRLSHMEQWEVPWYGIKRYKANVKAGTHKRAATTLDTVLNDIFGVGAEWAFCWLAKVAPDKTVGARRGGWDCVLPCGRTVDVKHITSKGHRLLVPTKKRFEDADIYVLMFCNYPLYTFVGWATAERVFKAPVRIYGESNDPAYTLEQHELETVLFIDDESMVGGQRWRA